MNLKPHDAPLAHPGARPLPVAMPSRAVSSSDFPRWTSETLLHGGQQVEIEHGDQVYRLRLTSLGKLILTK